MNQEDTVSQDPAPTVSAVTSGQAHTTVCPDCRCRAGDDHLPGCTVSQAASELLAVLKRIVTNIGNPNGIDRDDVRPAYDAALAAIAKAESL